MAVLDSTLIRRYGAEGGRHAHDHAQVLFGIDGTLALEVEGRGAWVDAACGLVIPAGDMHSYQARRTARVLVLDCAPGPATQRLRRFALPAGWRTVGAEPAALLGALAGAPTLAQRRPVDIDMLAARLDADLARPWTVADLAAACCLSPQRLRARFAERGEGSPLDFLRARRLDAAARLLRQGLGLEAAALQVGYGSASALSAALRRERDTGARDLRQGRPTGRAIGAS
jgi:AraC-like DNA-binding protein